MRGINDPIESDPTETSDLSELLYEMQEVVQRLIERNNILAERLTKLEKDYFDIKVEITASNLIKARGL